MWIWDIGEKTARCKTNDIKSVYAFAEYGENMLVGALDGLYLLKNGRIFKRSYSDYVGVIIQDINEGYFWIGVEGNLFYYDAAEDHLRPSMDLTGNYVKCLAFDDHDNLYIGTDNGLYVRNENEIMIFRHDSGNSSSIQNNIICDIYMDSEQNIWLGNNVGFSMISSKSQCEIVPIRMLTNSTEGSLIHAINLDASGNLWIGGTDGLIRCYESEGEMHSDWYKQSSRSFPILHNRVRGIYNDRDGDVWILTDHGINLYDKNSRQLVNFIVKEKDSDYSCTWAYDLYMDDDRNLWIAAFNEGVFVVNKETLLASGGICNADVFYGKSNGKLTGEHVYHILSAGNGQIWVSSNGGVDMIDPSTRTVKHVSEESATSMLLDSQGGIWTSFTNGLRCYDSLGDVLHDYYIEEEKNIKFIKIMEVEGLIWAVTQHNFRIVYPDGQITVYSLPDINVQTAYYAETEKKVIFGGMDNLAYVDCGIINKLNDRQSFLLTGITVNGRNYESDCASTCINRLKLRHNENNIEFYLTDVPDHEQISQLYCCTIKGSGEQWTRLAADKKINVNGLPYGDYELVVCSIDGLGNHMDEVYSLNIDITPPWYLTIFAKTIYLFFIILMTVAVRHFSIVKKQLREEEKRRTQILEQQEMRSLFYRNLSIELKKILFNIIAPSEKILRSPSVNKVKAYAEDIRYSSTQINALIRQAFDLNNPENSTRNLNVATVDVVRFCRGYIEVYEDKHPELGALEFTFQSEVPELYNTMSIVRFDSVFNILVNYLGRHSISGGNVHVSLKHTADEFIINLKAYPLAIRIVNVDRLFDRYNQVIEADDVTANSELYLAREYVHSMGGSLDADYDYNQKILSFKIVMPMDAIDSSSSEKESILENDSVSSDEKAKELAAITNIIEKHIGDFDFNVSMLQYELNVSEKTLYRHIKQLTGLTPIEYIRNIRMNRAALLLKEGNFTVSEVMYMVGFSNSGYFSKCFNAVYKTTPAKYKQKWKQR